jgi:hypothetical protein
MSSPTRLWEEQEERLVRFLLGDLPPAEQVEIEDRLFEDREFLDELSAAGDDLIHAYLTDSLSADDRARFEAHFLASPLRRERFNFVRGLVATAREASAADAPLHEKGLAAQWWWTLAAALLLVAGWLGTRPVVDRPADERVTVQLTPTPAPAARPTLETPVKAVVRLPGVPKDVVDVAVSASTETMRFEVPIADDRHPTYDAVLRDASGSRVFHVKGLIASGPEGTLVVELPARVLVADAYALHVEGERLRNAPRAAHVSVRYALRIVRSPAAGQRQSP